MVTEVNKTALLGALQLKPPGVLHARSLQTVMFLFKTQKSLPLFYPVSTKLAASTYSAAALAASPLVFI